MIEKLTKYRRDLHVIPEIGFGFYKTASYIKEGFADRKSVA